MPDLSFDSFTRQYIVTALWSSTDESNEQGGEPMDRNYDIWDIAPETLAKMAEDCAAFQAECAELITDENLLRKPDVDTWGTYGHDFWLTRNGHGAGFWDGDYREPAATLLDEASKRFGEYDLYVGDDGMIWGTRG